MFIWEFGGKWRIRFSKKGRIEWKELKDFGWKSFRGFVFIHNTKNPIIWRNSMFVLKKSFGGLT